MNIENLGAIELAHMAGVLPYNPESPGSVWLLKVRDAYLDNRDEIRDAGNDAYEAITENVAHPLSGGLSDTETWQVVTDLKLFLKQDMFDYGLYADSFERMNPSTYKHENVWAIEKDKLTSALQWWLYEVAGWLVQALLDADEPLDTDDEDDDETEGEG